MPSSHPSPFPPRRESPLPTRTQNLLFLGKAAVFRSRRLAQNLLQGPKRFSQCAVDSTVPVWVELESRLYPSELAAEFALQAGKVQNLRVAARHLHGLKLPAGSVFSFWAHVPRPSRSWGFVPGRELREGCIIPSVGGGLCQLSNALYDVALQAGFEIVERHAHSRRMPGSRAAAGRDATVFWNYVDLRWRVPADCQLEVFLTRTDLVVRIRGCPPAGTHCPAPAPAATIPAGPEANSCETCGMSACHRQRDLPPDSVRSLTAWLVDAWWPEFDEYLGRTRREGDWLFCPMDGRRWGLRSYRWMNQGFARICPAPLEVLRRSWASRRLAAQGARRQKALLRFDEALARRHARGLPAEAMHLVVSQNLLPFLWQEGALAGRSFDVLMTRLPLEALQGALDAAALAHPESPTLGDFRADAALVAAESAALAEARHWITPHSTVARLAGCKAVKLDWHLPPAQPMDAPRTKIVFPASTLGRKGAYELREAARKLGLRIQLGGPVLECVSFWDGVETVPAGAQWQAGAALVVLPSWGEAQPRRLLQALADGIPVIATEACGLEGVAGALTLLKEGDGAGLAAALEPHAQSCRRAD